MWTITEDGYTSVVRYVPTKDLVNKEHRALAENSDNPKDWLIIRARVKADLERIEKVSGLDLHIATDSSADYAYRGLARTADWKAYMAQAIENIDYDSHFKEVVRDRAPKVDGRYNGMMSIWSATAKWQDLTPYGGFGGGWVGGGWTGKKGKSKGWSKGWSGGAAVDTRPGEDLTPLFGESEYSVSLEDMVNLIVESGCDAMKLDPEKVNDASDAAFELWVRVCDFNERGDIITASEVKALAEDIRSE